MFLSNMVSRILSVMGLFHKCTTVYFTGDMERLVHALLAELAAPPFLASIPKLPMTPPPLPRRPRPRSFLRWCPAQLLHRDWERNQQTVLSSDVTRPYILLG